jgi:hypothetical protein
LGIVEVGAGFGHGVRVARVVDTAHMELVAVEPDLIAQELGIKHINRRTGDDVVSICAAVSGPQIMTDELAILRRLLQYLRRLLLAPGTRSHRAM